MALGKVIVATDLSRASHGAVLRAALIARSHGAQLEVLHVLPSKALEAPWHWFKDEAAARYGSLRDEASAKLQELVARLAGGGALDVRAQLAEGTPSREIAARAEAIGAGLVVIGAHGAHALLDIFVGTTAQELVRRSSIPVLLAKEAPPSEYERVLVATDFSDHARAAARLAAELFPAGALYLFHAYELPFEGKMSYAGVDLDVIQSYRTRAASALGQELDEFARSLGPAGSRAARSVQHGHPPRRLIEQARRIEADLIVAGAHGKSGLETALLGSVSAHLIAEAHCDVLVAGR